MSDVTTKKCPHCEKELPPARGVGAEKTYKVFRNGIQVSEVTGRDDGSRASDSSLGSGASSFAVSCAQEYGRGIY